LCALLIFCNLGLINLLYMRLPVRVFITLLFTVIIMVVVAPVVWGQQLKHVKPTSATDPTIKVHDHRKLSVFKNNHPAKQERRYARATERQGESLRKKNKRSLKRQWQVFGRQNHFATRDISLKSKQRKKQALGAADYGDDY